MSDELQCCPFCGGKGVEAEFQSDIGGGDFQYVFGVWCSNESCLVRPRCNVRGERGYEREGDVPNVEARKSAIAAWNTRRPTPEQSGDALSPNELSALLPGCYYMDPPDGGSVTLLEQLHRMAQDAARYRWLRDTYRLCYYAQCLPPSFGFARVIGPGTLDIEIDRAIAAIDRSALGREG